MPVRQNNNTSSYKNSSYNNQNKQQYKENSKNQQNSAPKITSSGKIILPDVLTTYNKTLLFVGDTGCGKSSLIKYISSYQNIDTVNPKTYNTESLRFKEKVNDAVCVLREKTIQGKDQNGNQTSTRHINKYVFTLKELSDRKQIKNNMKNVFAVFVVLDLSKSNYIERALEWITSIKSSDPKMHIFGLANKDDLCTFNGHKDSPSNPRNLKLPIYTVPCTMKPDNEGGSVLNFIEYLEL